MDDERHWVTLGERIVPVGRWRLAVRDVRLPDGSRIEYTVDSARFAVAALLVVDGDVLLTRQYRYPIDQWIHDLPAGGADPDEEPLAAVRREVEEELGVVPADLRPLHTFFVNPGRSTWPVHLYFGTVVEPGRASRSDPAEQIRPVRMPLGELDVRIAAGEIVDPTLIVARAMAGARGFLPALGPADG